MEITTQIAGPDQDHSTLQHWDDMLWWGTALSDNIDVEIAFERRVRCCGGTVGGDIYIKAHVEQHLENRKISKFSKVKLDQIKASTSTRPDQPGYLTN